MKIMPIKICKTFKNMTNPEYAYNNSETNYFGGKKYSKKVFAKEQLKKIEEMRNSNLIIHEENKVALENNIKLKNEIISFMTGIGISTVYRTKDPKSRARFPKDITLPSGYMNDISRTIVLSDSFEASELEYEVLKKKYLEFIDKCEKDELNEKTAAEKLNELKIKERKDNLEYSRLILKYNLDIKYEWEDILDHLLDKNKYLRLAHAMLKTRNDWNEGFYRVENAFRGFSIETDIDNKISQCIDNILNDNEGDGRIFRDCEYSYDVLFSMVDSDLFIDYNVVYDKLGDD
jgi:hypothetical protein